MRISLVSNKKEEKVPNAYSASHKKGHSKKSRGPIRKVNMSKIESYQCQKMDHYRSHCPDNPKNKKRNRYQSNVVEEGSPKKKKTEESEIKDLYY